MDRKMHQARTKAGLMALSPLPLCRGAAEQFLGERA